MFVAILGHQNLEHAFLVALYVTAPVYVRVLSRSQFATHLVVFSILPFHFKIGVVGVGRGSFFAYVSIEARTVA